ncbi:hypothetical protein M1N05_00105 [Dehalococcoidales bacterium]|nr:hypothetical protein [Dehalococcoidales bacterium]
MAKIEGAFEQVSERLNHIELRLNHIETRLDTKADKWEIRIWFLLLIILMTVYQFLG